jgi:hypothetical protein
MDSGDYQKSVSTFLWTLIITFCLGFVLIFIIAPHFFGNRKWWKANLIIVNLRCIDAAKKQWAFERGITNSDQIAHFSRPLSWSDIGPYLGVVQPISGVVYTINSLNKPPEAKLTHNVEWLHKGTIVYDDTRTFPSYLEQTNN